LLTRKQELDWIYEQPNPVKASKNYNKLFAEQFH